MTTISAFNLEVLARVSHEANRSWCRHHGDDSQPPWEEAPEWQKESARKGVLGVLAGNTPEQSHDGWLAEKVATGWKFGPAKDPEKREHPCMVPYAELPPVQRQKDHIFVGTVRTWAAALGVAIGNEGE